VRLLPARSRYIHIVTRALQTARLRLVQPDEGRIARERVSVAPALDDSELIAAVRSGDSSAATAFYDRLRPRVDGTIRRLLGRHDDEAEDLAQLSLIELIRSIARYRGECSLESWAATVTAHVVYKHLRRRTHERRLFDRSGNEEPGTSPPASVPRAIVARDLVQRLRAHLDAMEEPKAWTFLLHDVAGFDLREIAQITGVSVAAAQTRLVRGRRDVHERIAADPELAGLLTELEDRA
jgi:RNA polymerase sigma-70 factor (ECF subfamily)